MALSRSLSLNLNKNNSKLASPKSKKESCVPVRRRPYEYTSSSSSSSARLPRVHSILILSTIVHSVFFHLVSIRSNRLISRRFDYPQSVPMRIHVCVYNLRFVIVKRRVRDRVRSFHF